MKLDFLASIKFSDIIHVSRTRQFIHLPSSLKPDVPIRAEIPEERDHEGNANHKVAAVLAHRLGGCRWQWWTHLEETQQHDAEW